MTVRGLLRKFLAIARRDWLDSVRHRSGFFVQAGTTAAQLAGFYLFARAIGPQYQPKGMDYYPFLLVGTAMFSFYVSGMNAFVGNLKEAQITGTLEAVLNTNTSAPMLVGLSAGSVFFGGMLRMVIFIIIGAVPFARTLHPNWPAAVMVVLLSVVMAVSMAMFAAAAQVLLHRGDVVAWLFGIGGWLLTGTAFPISGLPAGLRAMALLVPATYSIEALRATLLLQGAWGPVAHSLAVLALSAAVLLPLSAVVLAGVIHRARRNGTLSYF